MATISTSERSSISQILRAVGETLFWGATASGLILFSLSSAIQLLLLPSETFEIFLGLRLALAGLAVGALLWRSVGNELGRMAPPMAMIVVMTERVFELGWMGPDAVSVGALDGAALLFLAAAAVYRGESRRWWSTLMPWAVLNQLMLLMELSQKAGTKTTDLTQGALIIAIAFIGSCVFFAVRSARVVESQAEFDRSVEAVTSLKEVQEEIRILVNLLTAKEKMAEELQASETQSAALAKTQSNPTSARRATVAASPETFDVAQYLSTNLAPLEDDSVEPLGLPNDTAVAFSASDLNSNKLMDVISAENLQSESAMIALADHEFHHDGPRDEEVSKARSYSRANSMQVALHYPMPSDIPTDELLDPVDVFEILKAIVSRQGAAIQHEWDATKPRDRAFKAQTKLSLNAPTESAWPIVVRANKEFLKSAFHSLLLRAIESANSSGRGIVRVNFRVGLSVLSISIEDNGRGFSEEKLRALSFPEDYLGGDKSANESASLESAWQSNSAARFSPKFMGVSEIREHLVENGNQFDFQARLGVGTRAILDFHRLDAYSSQKIRTPRSTLTEVETRRF